MFRFCTAGAAVAAQLKDIAVEGDQFAVEMVKGAETKIAVFQQVRHRGIAFVDAAQQGAHQ
ncbi:hypothetical protein D3C80_2191770 [compost metagenome]